MLLSATSDHNFYLLKLELHNCILTKYAQRNVQVYKTGNVWLTDLAKQTTPEEEREGRKIQPTVSHYNTQIQVNLFMWQNIKTGRTVLEVLLPYAFLLSVKFTSLSLEQDIKP